MNQDLEKTVNSINAKIERIKDLLLDKMIDKNPKEREELIEVYLMTERLEESIQKINQAE